MKTERDINIRISEIEYEITQEKKSESPSEVKINELKIIISALLWVIKE
jgi:hypothetical protein